LRHGAFARRFRGRLLAATLSMVALGVALAGSADGAESGECEWRPHKVRVVKYVKRHGKRVRVVRQRVRWSCVAVSGAPSGTPGATPPSSAPTPQGSGAPIEEPGNPHWFGAQAYEYGFNPTGPSFEVAAGKDTIELINRGEDAHDLYLKKVGAKDNLLELNVTAAGGHTHGSVSLEPGEYRLYCSLDDHAMRGMERTLVVVP
jgi:plastocyanin